MFTRLSTRCLPVCKQFQRSFATIKLNGDPFSVTGELPQPGSTAPDFAGLVASDLSEAGFDTYEGKKKILNIFPSIDTPVCAKSVGEFNEKASHLSDAVVLCVSADLPFALTRFCGEEFPNIQALSCFRSDFATAYGVKIVDGPLAGVTARAIVVLDETNKVLHSELVPEILQEPDYDAALAAVGVKIGQ